MFTAEVPGSRVLTPAKVERLIRQQPGELLWHQVLMNVVPRHATRHRRALVDSLVAVLAHQDLMPELVADRLLTWKWKDAARVATELERSGGPAAAAVFLGRIAQSVDDRPRCLAAARAALDASPPSDAADWAATVGLILVQQAPALFLERLSSLAAATRVEFILYKWAASAAPRSEAQARVRERIAALRPHRRDWDGEVKLALVDGDDALCRGDTITLRDCLERLERFAPGSTLHFDAVLAFLRSVSKQRGLSVGINRVLKVLLPTRSGAAAAAMLRRRSRR